MQRRVHTPGRPNNRRLMLDRVEGPVFAAACEVRLAAPCDYMWSQPGLKSMKTLGLRDAKASLSAVIEAAERGEATTITKHGRPAAVVVPVEQAKAPLSGRSTEL